MRIATSDRRTKALDGQADIARRLQTMSGMGPLTVLAIEAFAPQMETFKRARDFSPWLGLVPKQHPMVRKCASAASPRPGRVTSANC